MMGMSSSFGQSANSSRVAASTTAPGANIVQCLAGVSYDPTLDCSAVPGAGFGTGGKSKREGYAGSAANYTVAYIEYLRAFGNRFDRGLIEHLFYLDGSENLYFRFLEGNIGELTFILTSFRDAQKVSNTPILTASAIAGVAVLPDGTYDALSAAVTTGRIAYRQTALGGGPLGPGAPFMSFSGKARDFVTAAGQRENTLMTHLSFKTGSTARGVGEGLQKGLEQGLKLVDEAVKHVGEGFHALHIAGVLDLAIEVGTESTAFLLGETAAAAVLDTGAIGVTAVTAWAAGRTIDDAVTSIVGQSMGVSAYESLNPFEEDKYADAITITATDVNGETFDVTYVKPASEEGGPLSTTYTPILSSSDNQTPSNVDTAAVPSWALTLGSSLGYGYQLNGKWRKGGDPIDPSRFPYDTASTNQSKVRPPGGGWTDPTPGVGGVGGGDTYGSGPPRSPGRTQGGYTDTSPGRPGGMPGPSGPSAAGAGGGHIGALGRGGGPRERWECPYIFVGRFWYCPYRINPQTGELIRQVVPSPDTAQINRDRRSSPRR